jgi:hypothetical protein
VAVVGIESANRLDQGQVGDLGQVLGVHAAFGEPVRHRVGDTAVQQDHGVEQLAALRFTGCRRCLQQCAGTVCSVLLGRRPVPHAVGIGEVAHRCIAPTRMNQIASGYVLEPPPAP